MSFLTNKCKLTRTKDYHKAYSREFFKVGKYHKFLYMFHYYGRVLANYIFYMSKLRARRLL